MNWTMTRATGRARRSAWTEEKAALGGVFFLAYEVNGGMPKLTILAGAALMFGLAIRHLRSWPYVSTPLYLPPWFYGRLAALTWSACGIADNTAPSEAVVSS
jgi:hypothetical protein